MELLKLIIVDDEKIILQGLTETYDWNSIGFEVVGTALNGEDALRLIETEMPDVVLTDICMKRMNGIELMERTKQISPEIRFVVLSAYKDFEYAQKACALGAFSYVVKPVDDEMLVTMQQLHDLCVEEKKKRDTYEQWHSLLVEDKESFYTYMIERFLEDGISLQEMRDTCGMFMDDTSEQHFYAVLCVDVDVVYRIRDFGEFDAKRFALFTYMEKGLKENYQIWIHRNSDGSRKFIVDLGESDKVYKIKLLLQSAKQELGFDIISAITKAFQGLEGMKTAYHQSLQLYALACELETDMEEDIVVEEDARYPYEAESHIMAAIRKNDEESVKEGFIEFLAALGKNENADKIYLHQLTVHVELLVKETYGWDEEVRKRFQELYLALFGYSSSRLVHVCYDLCLYIIKMRKENIPYGEEQFYNEYVMQACAFIEKHLDEEGLSIGMVADAVHLNAVYFGRVFKAVMNMSFKQYLLKQKIEMAKHMLLTTDASITEIGRMVGISNSSYFTKLFKQLVGKLPSDYRISQK